MLLITKEHCTCQKSETRFLGGGGGGGGGEAGSENEDCGLTADHRF